MRYIYLLVTLMAALLVFVCWGTSTIFVTTDVGQAAPEMSDAYFEAGAFNTNVDEKVGFVLSGVFIGNVELVSTVGTLTEAMETFIIGFVMSPDSMVIC